MTSVAIAVVTGGLVSFVSSYARTGFATQDLISKKLALNGFMDYTLIALKQRWCFTEDWQREAPDSCTLFHTKSAERLFLRDTSAGVLRDLSVSLPTPLSLTEFSTSIDISSITQRHPLYVMADLMVRTEAAKVNFKVRRIENNIIASQGEETYIRINIEIEDKNGRVSSIESLTAFFPREVASFALLVNKMDLSKDAAQPPLVRGIASIPVAPRSYAGLTFDSPVFVNRDINLPVGTYSGRPSSSYSPVMFLAPVVMGSGKLTESDQPFVPVARADQLLSQYAQSDSFGGFKAGIHSDGQRDRGISVLVGDSSASTMDMSLTSLCIERNNYLSNLKSSKRSELVLKQTANLGHAAETSATYILSFSQFNEFKGIGITKKILDRNYDRLISSNTLVSRGTGQSVLEVEIEYNSGRSETRYRMARGAEFVVKSGGDRGYIEGRIRDHKRDRNREQRKLDDLNRLKQMFANHAALVARIDQLKDKKDNGGLSQEEKDELKDKKKAERRLDDDIEDLARRLTGNKHLTASQCDAKILESQGKIAAFNQQIGFQMAVLNNPPEIRVETKEVEVDGKSHPGLVELKISIKNSQNISDPPRIKIEGYDVAYEYHHGRIQSTRNFHDGTLAHGYDTFGEIGLPQDANNLLSLEPLNTSRWYSASNRGRVINEPPLEDKNLFVKCEQDSDNNMLPHASWDIDFSPHSFHSWSFSNRHQDNTNISFTRTDAARGDVEFSIRSMMNRCRVRSTANFLVGFFHCKEFVIEQRSTPLRIIGTVIAHSLSIHRTALQHGIHWSSIYHPQAVEELRATDVGVLTPDEDIPAPYNSCAPSLSVPVWHPNPSPYSIAARYGCNASSLRAKADPFTWSTVDPDCAKIDDSPGTKCKRHIKRFVIKEYGRTIQL